MAIERMNKDTFIRFRVTSEEKEQIDDLARKNGETVTSMIKRLIEQERNALSDGRLTPRQKQLLTELVESFKD